MGEGRKFGVEEEYLLLDADTGLPRDRANELIAALPGLRAENEFLLSQLETATKPSRSAGEALEQLREFRVAAQTAASDLGLILAGSGLPPIGGETISGVSQHPRYLQIQDQVRGAVRRYYSTGTHVHVEVPSREAGLAAIAHFARWSPLLMALAANSPVYLGESTGYCSWRNQFIQQWATSGYPPPFADVADYDRTVDALVGVGALVDRALVNWSIRLSERFPTVELRTADAQLTPEDSVAFAVLLRALIARGLREFELGGVAPDFQPDAMRSAHWLAARDGLTGDLFDPFVVERRPIFELVDEMLEYAADELEASGDADFIEGYIERRRADLGPAQVQLRAWETGGVEGLLELYARGFV